MPFFDQIRYKQKISFLDELLKEREREKEIKEERYSEKRKK